MSIVAQDGHGVSAGAGADRGADEQQLPSRPVTACPFCGESILTVAIKCKHCGEFINSQTGNAVAQGIRGAHVPEGKSTGKGDGLNGCFRIVLIVVVLYMAAMLYMCTSIFSPSDSGSSGSRGIGNEPYKSDTAADSPGSSTQIEVRGEKDWVTAFVMMQESVKSRLRSPGSAKFPGVWDGVSDHVKYIGNQSYRIESYVDAQNGFGAMVRMSYKGEIKYAGGERWTLISLNLSEK